MSSDCGINSRPVVMAAWEENVASPTNANSKISKIDVNKVIEDLDALGLLNKRVNTIIQEIRNKEKIAQVEMSTKFINLTCLGRVIYFLGWGSLAKLQNTALKLSLLNVIFSTPDVFPEVIEALRKRAIKV